MNAKMTVAIVGLGSRGKDTYAEATKLYSDKMEIVAIADIDSSKVDVVAKEYNIKAENCFSSAEELLEHDKLADVIFIATQDRQHVPQALVALKRGYHILLEKPISPLLDECRELVKVAKECNKLVVVCHVLRYTPIYSKLKEIIETGTIGDIATVLFLENVGYWHQAHSFVRGSWRDSNTTSPMILQKCCHDMDLLLWLTGKTCESISSFGSTYLFKKERAPKGSTNRCMDGCAVKETCPFDAEKIYLTNKKIGIMNGHTAWPLDVLALKPTVENIKEAIKTGPYGRCVYQCDNNVVDHQVVNLQMTDGSTISHTMTAFTTTGSRYGKFMGTKGEIVVDMSENTIKTTLFGEKTDTIDVTKLSDDFSGHGGGDTKMVEEFIMAVMQGKEVGNKMTTVDRSVESHCCAMAAEKSRLENGAVISIQDLR